MKLKGITDPTISLEKYEWSFNIKNKLNYDKWVEYIDAHKDYFTWYEDTDDGIKTKNTINEVPEDFREGVLLKLQKQQVRAEYNPKKCWYEVVIDFHKNFGIIHTTFMKPLKKEHLTMLLNIANYLDAFLLNNGKTIIDKKVIDDLQ